MTPKLRGADLHTHTVFSDGVYTPESLAETALERALRAVAVTDHDTVGGVAATREAAEGTGLDVVAGVEFAAPKGYNEIHIVGLFVDVGSEVLREALEKIRRQRLERMLEAIRRLGRLGIHVSAKKVLEAAAPAAPGRAHLADALVANGVTPNTKTAFQRYLANGMPAHVRRFYPSHQDAIEIIHAAGGIAVYAHPLLTGEDEFVPEMAKAGLDAVEVRHPYHSTAVEQRYRRICGRCGLLPAGGSDCHGHGAGMMGMARLSDEEYDTLRDAAERVGVSSAAKERKK